MTHPTTRSNVAQPLVLRALAVAAALSFALVGCDGHSFDAGVAPPAVVGPSAALFGLVPSPDGSYLVEYDLGSGVAARRTGRGLGGSFTVTSIEWIDATGELIGYDWGSRELLSIDLAAGATTPLAGVPDLQIPQDLCERNGELWGLVGGALARMSMDGTATLVGDFGSGIEVGLAYRADLDRFVTFDLTSDDLEEMDPLTGQVVRTIPCSINGSSDGALYHDAQNSQYLFFNDSDSQAVPPRRYLLDDETGELLGFSRFPEIPSGITFDGSTGTLLVTLGSEIGRLDASGSGVTELFHIDMSVAAPSIFGGGSGVTTYDPVTRHAYARNDLRIRGYSALGGESFDVGQALFGGTCAGLSQIPGEVVVADSTHIGRFDLALQQVVPMVGLDWPAAFENFEPWAICAGSLPGELILAANRSLLTFDSATGALLSTVPTTIVAETSFDRIHGLDREPASGNLRAVTTYGMVYSIDPTTGDATSLGRWVPSAHFPVSFTYDPFDATWRYFAPDASNMVEVQGPGSLRFVDTLGWKELDGLAADFASEVAYSIAKTGSIQRHGDLAPSRSLVRIQKDGTQDLLQQPNAPIEFRSSGLVFDAVKNAIYTSRAMSTELHEIDPTSGASSLLGTTSSIIRLQTWEPSTGTALALDYSGGTLLRCDPVALTVSTIGAPSHGPLRCLACDPATGVVYGVTADGGRLVEVNTSDGSTTQLGNGSYSSQFASFLPW